MSTAFHPQTDGQSERAVRSLKQMLRAYVNQHQNDWDLLLTPLEFAYNNAPNESTGETPFFLNYGQHPNVLSVPWSKHPIIADNDMARDYLERIRKALASAKRVLSAAQQRQKQYADRKCREHQFQVGGKVLLSTEHLRRYPGAGAKRSLGPVSVGPYKVLGVLADGSAVRLELPPSLPIHPVVNVSRLQPYREDNGQFPGRQQNIQPGPLFVQDGQEYFVVDSFLDTRSVRGGGRSWKRQVYVRWKDYGPEWDLWVDESLLKQDLGKPEFDKFMASLRG